MSTRSRIGIIRERPENAAPIVESIYCHFDGYPEGVGQTLLDHWSTTERVNKLLSYGDLSSLGTVIGEMHDFDMHTGSYVDGAYVEGEASRLGWCLYYGRDRGELECVSRTHAIDKWPDYGQEAEYLFDPDTTEWRVRRQDFNPVGWNTVTPWEGWIDIPAAIALEMESRVIG